MKAAETDTVEPDCRYASTLGEGNRWEKKPLTDMLRAWYDPCSECFPDGEIDTDEVVKKRTRGSTRQSLHRPA